MKDGKRQRIFKVDCVEMCNGSFDDSIVGYGFCTFKKGNTIRYFSLDDASDSPAFSLINGKWIGTGCLHDY